MTSQKKLIGIVVLLFCFISGPAIAEKKPVAPTPEPVACMALAATIAGQPGVKNVTSVLGSSGSTPICQVDILYGENVDQNINIRIGLPLNSLDGGSGNVQGNWNGRTLGNGGGVCFGTLSVNGVQSGYVGSGTDTGHGIEGCEPGVNDDNTYNYQYINDFIRNAIKQQVLFAKSVATTYYGMKPLYNYWNSCSTGGRQGYLLAQELPTELDGILANAPAMYWTRFQTAQIWGQVVMKDLVGGVISGAKLNAATAAAVLACDADDGVTDGVIDDPRTCTFSAVENICGQPNAPATNCLTPEEAQAIDMIWDGPRNAKGDKIWFGLDRGTSLTALNGGFPFSNLTYQLEWDTHTKNFDLATVTIDNYPDLAEEASRNIADVTDTFGNLDEFRRHGGKLLTWVGANDQLIMPLGVINYYREMAARYDYRQDHASSGTGSVPGHGNDVDFTGVQEFYRLFRVPGAGHCNFGGTGPFDALVAWVENENHPAPDYIDGTVGARNVRVCPYPQTAIYNGSGDINDPNNYTCGGNLETADTVCEDVLAKYKHEVKGPLDYTGTGFNQHECY